MVHRIFSFVNFLFLPIAYFSSLICENLTLYQPYAFKNISLFYLTCNFVCIIFEVLKWKTFINQIYQSLSLCFLPLVLWVERLSPCMPCLRLDGKQSMFYGMNRGSLHLRVSSFVYSKNIITVVDIFRLEEFGHLAIKDTRWNWHCG